MSLRKSDKNDNIDLLRTKMEVVLMVVDWEFFHSSEPGISPLALQLDMPD